MEQDLHTPNVKATPLDEESLVEERFRKHVAGIHAREDGTMAVVWVAREANNDTAHLYDAHIFEREVLPVIVSGLNSRGKWIPIACQSEDVVEALWEHGVNVLDVEKESDVLAELSTLEVWERFRTGRLKVKRDLTNWIEEFKTYNREDSRVPKDTHPLMSATRVALAHIDQARAQAASAKSKNYKEVAIV